MSFLVSIRQIDVWLFLFFGHGCPLFTTFTKSFLCFYFGQSLWILRYKTIIGSLRSWRLDLIIIFLLTRWFSLLVLFNTVFVYWICWLSAIFKRKETFLLSLLETFLVNLSLFFCQLFELLLIIITEAPPKTSSLAENVFLSNIWVLCFQLFLLYLVKQIISRLRCLRLRTKIFGQTLRNSGFYIIKQWIISETLLLPTEALSFPF